MTIGLIANYPLASLVVISFILTVLLTLSYKVFSNQKEIKETKEKIKDLQKRAKAEKDKEKAMALQKEMMQVNMEHMKHNMKPLLITFLPLILIFWWLRVTYLPYGNLIDYSADIPMVCFVFRGFCDGLGWFLVYVITSIIFNQLLRKIMKVH